MAIRQIPMPQDTIDVVWRKLCTDLHCLLDCYHFFICGCLRRQSRHTCTKGVKGRSMFLIFWQYLRINHWRIPRLLQSKNLACGNQKGTDQALGRRDYHLFETTVIGKQSRAKLTTGTMLASSNSSSSNHLRSLETYSLIRLWSAKVGMYGSQVPQ